KIKTGAITMSISLWIETCICATWGVESATTKSLFRPKMTLRQQKMKTTERSPNGRTSKMCNNLRSLHQSLRHDSDDSEDSPQLPGGDDEEEPDLG
ncbi:hypothetical protein K438DRAFT_1815369, partial [Mycena galopus ATCC 62051]